MDTRERAYLCLYERCERDRGLAGSFLERAPPFPRSFLSTPLCLSQQVKKSKMQRVFTTVGTTSFDQLVESVCSISFLNATLQQSITRRLSPVASSLQSTLDVQDLWPTLEILHYSDSPHSTQSSESSQHLSFTDTVLNSSDDIIEIAIQYGRGKCPLQFLPSGISRELECSDDGSVSVRFTPDSGAIEHLTLNIIWYRFKPSLSVDMDRANLILCHAGAGTLLEAMSLSKEDAPMESTQQNDTHHKVINAVINSSLMDNHQSELAEELEKRRHIMVTKKVAEWTTPTGACNFWKRVNDFVPTPFLAGCGLSRVDQTTEHTVSNFQSIVDRVMGI